MDNIKVSYKHEYNIEFINDDSPTFEDLAKIDFTKHDRLFLIYDENVEKLYSKIIEEKICKQNNNIINFSVSAQEYSKSIGFYPKLVNFLENNNVGRYDAIIAIGGGIIIDLVSFTVSTYMRGLPLYIIATTLIGQIDASTAGKTCLNSEHNKNLLGTFYYPKYVYNNTNTLKTTTKRIMRQGLSEALKYGLLNSNYLVDNVIKYQYSYTDDILKQIIIQSIKSRIEIRKIDPLASNLGHTFGHALEKYYDFKILHGDAITIGTVFALYFAKHVGIMTSSACDNINKKIIKAKLNYMAPCELDIDKYIEIMKSDKKSSSQYFNLVLIEDIEKPLKNSFYKVEHNVVHDFLKEFLTSYQYKTNNYIEYLKQEELS